MQISFNTSKQKPEGASIEEQSNLACVLLSNKFFNIAFPPLAYIVAIIVQTPLNDLVRIPYGASIVYLTFGVRLFVALIFGFQGLLWMVLGQVFVFAFYPTPNYQNHPLKSLLLTCIYSLVAYLVVEGVKKVRNLDEDFRAVKTSDILLITFISVLVATIFHCILFDLQFQDPIYGMLTSFAGKFVGTMIGFYGLMLLFSFLYNWKTSSRT